MKNIPYLLRCCASLLLLFAATAISTRAALPEDCCLALPPAPNNEADGIVKVTYGNPAGQETAPASYFTVDLLPGDGVSPTPPIPPATYQAWCFDATTDIDPGEIGTLYTAKLYASCDPAVSFNQFLPDHPNVKVDAATWKKINYLINHRALDCNGNTPRMWEVQRAIFLLFGQTPPPTPPYPTYREVVVQCLIDSANANAAAWNLQCGDKVAVIFNVQTNWDNLDEEEQLIFLEVPWCPPVICPEDVTVECGDSLDPAVNPALGAPSLSECCTGLPAPTYVDSAPVGTCPTVITRTWTVTTACGTETCVQTITIVDRVAPIIGNVGGPLEVDCSLYSDTFFSVPTATDECGEVASFTFEDKRTEGNCAGSFSVTRLWTAVDACGNTATASQTIAVSDTKAPVISGVGGSLEIECGQPLQFSEPTAIDDCSGVKSITFSDATNPGNCAGSYSITRTWTAVDNCGNASSASQTITVQDRTPPVIECPPDKRLTCGSPSDPGSTGMPTATDNCSAVGALVITHSDEVVVDASGNTIITRTWQVVDECGNMAQCAQKIQVEPGGCEPGEFYFGGGSHSNGQPNVRTFTAGNGVSVKVTGFSRTDSGTWNEAFVAQYSGGLGITDTSEDGSAPNHTVDNVGRYNYLLFEFSQPVIIDEAALGYVYGDSDLSIRIGTFSDPYNNHVALNDASFAAFGYAEDNDTTSGSPRTASLNAGQVSGNALIIAASLSDTSPDDYFKVKTLEFCAPICEPPVQKASLGDYVWEDTNVNGIQDGGEPGVNGVTVQLLDCANNAVVGTTVTASGGYYLFTGLTPGDYYVKFALPSGYVFSPKNAGSNDALDSDADGTTGRTDCTTLVSGENDLTWDAGINKPQPPPEEECVPAKLVFSGSSSTDGRNGNIRTYSVGGVSVKVSAFSRSSWGNWDPAYLGIYGGGLGVTDSSEGSGSYNRHTVDNIDRENYVLFEFSQPVVVNAAYLGYVVDDSDLSIRIGTFADPYNNHLTLNDATLAAFGHSEENSTGSSSARWANFNGGEVSGNTLIIAASLLESRRPNDSFKIEKLGICVRSTTTPNPPNPPNPPSPPEDDCPSPWDTRDIGNVSKSGSITYNSQTRKFTVKGSGEDIWGSSDEFRYGYQKANGDCIIAARIVTQENTDPWAKAGVMIRETLNANSKHASAFITPGNGVAFQYRNSTGDSSGNENHPGETVAHWLAVIRNGNTFTAYHSENGNDWTPIGSRWISMGSSVYIGIAVTSHDDSELSAATMDNVFAAP